MLDTVYRTTLARMGAHPDADYYALPSYWRGLADAAAEAQSAFWAASLAASNARAASAWGAVEALDGAEMDTYATWQRLERIGAELLDATPAATAQGIGGHPIVILIGPILFALCGAGILAALASLGIALARLAALADRRTLAPAPPFPHPAPAPPFASHPTMPTAAHHVASEIHDRALAEIWRREGRLTPAGYARLCALMDTGADVYPYWSGGESHGTAVVWDGTRGRVGERVTVEGWNADADANANAATDRQNGGAA